MFGRKRGKVPGAYTHLEGVITFFGSHHALLAEKVLKENGFDVALIPGPRAISPNCGVALRFEYDLMQECKRLLENNSVNFEAFHHYPER